MKKTILSALALVSMATSFAQLSQDNAGYVYDNTNAASNCYLNSAPNNGGIMSVGNTLTNDSKSSSLAGTSGPLVLTSVATLPQGGTATWFPLPYIDAVKDQCTTLNGAALGVDLTNNSKVEVTGTASVDGAVLEVFLGGEGQWSPGTSTYNTGNAGASIIASVTLGTTAGTFVIDFASIDQTVWDAWTGRNKVQSIGFRSATAGAVFNVSKVNIGTSVLVGTADQLETTVSVYPNPANGSVKVGLSTSASQVSVEMMSLTSQVVMSEVVAVNNNEVNLNTEAIADGIYILKINAGLATELTKKVVIKH